MADELTINLSMSLVKGNVSMSRSDKLTVDVTGTGLIHNVQNIGFAAAEALTVAADIGTEGYMFCRNIDATNFVYIGPDSTGIVNFIKLLPTEIAMFRLATGTIMAQADTAAVDLEYWIIEA